MEYFTLQRNISGTGMRAGKPGRMCLWAPAKVNLALDVVGRRPDGYHALRSIMASVSLFDTVLLERAEEGVLEVSWEGAEAPLPLDNTARRAALAFFKQRPGGARIHIIKRIPMEAGLGGGSADAAAVLRGLWRLYGGVDKACLFSMAQEVGADVPFCLLGGCALAQGIGEQLTPLPPPRLHLLLVKGRAGVSTAALFRGLGSLSCHPDVPAACAALQGPLEGLLPHLENALEPPAAALAPEIPRLKARLLEAGALAACMTGSGAAVAGIFPSRAAARAAWEKFQDVPFRALCRTGYFAV